MKSRTGLRRLAAVLIGAVPVAALATPVAIDIGNPSNGIVGIYSATFDAALSPCVASSPSYCPFFLGEPPGGFIGDPPSGRRISTTPTPTGLINGVPSGINPVPTAGSYLDLTLAADKSTLTISGGTISVPTIGLVIQGDAQNPAPTVITAVGAGFVFNAAPHTVAINANRQAELFVDLYPTTIAADFTTLSVAINPPGSCSGPLCVLVGILTLDMFRYRLLIQYDATFDSFTGTFIGQTGNNSMVFATLNSLPKISVSNSSVSFGSVEIGSPADQSVTVTNSGTTNVVLGSIWANRPLDSPFSVVNDLCSLKTLAQNEACSFGLRFQPTAIGDFQDSVDIPSNYPPVTIGVSGSGVLLTEPVIQVTDQQVVFNDLVPTASEDHAVTVTNAGTAPLVIGSVGAADPLAAPFSIVTDGCSPQPVAPTASCTIVVRFAPAAVDAFTDSFDIQSNDPNSPSVTVSTTGNGVALIPPIPVPNPSGANSGLFGAPVDPLTLLAIPVLAATARRLRRLIRRG